MNALTLDLALKTLDAYAIEGSLIQDTNEAIIVVLSGEMYNKHNK